MNPLSFQCLFRSRYPCVKASSATAACHDLCVWVWARVNRSGIVVCSDISSHNFAPLRDLSVYAFSPCASVSISFPESRFAAWWIGRGEPVQTQLLYSSDFGSPRAYTYLSHGLVAGFSLHAHSFLFILHRHPDWTINQSCYLRVWKTLGFPSVPKLQLLVLCSLDNTLAVHTV